MHPLVLVIPHAERPFGGDEVLAYYNGPLLFWLPAENRRLLAVALPDEVGAWPFLVVELTEAAALDLLADRLTLMRAVKGATAAYLLRDYGAPQLELDPLKAEQIPEDWLPGDCYLTSDAAPSP